MTNAEVAIKLVINFFESEMITVRTSEIIPIVNKWESKFDPIDPISLAALTIANPINSAISTNEIREIREFYFPSKNCFERSFF